jgi:pyochelin synthetase
MLHIVNPRGEPCPDWVTGEIEIAGQGLARGYWRDPVQTAERFRRDPLTGERRYRTGDRGRFRPYATAPAGSPTPIEFLGREDSQVKIGGHRVELGEIETVLGSHSAVTAAVATAVATDPANRTGKTLHAFVTLAAAGADGEAAWQRSIGAARGRRRRTGRPDRGGAVRADQQHARRAGRRRGRCGAPPTGRIGGDPDRRGADPRARRRSALPRLAGADAARGSAGRRHGEASHQPGDRRGGRAGLQPGRDGTV